MWYGITYGKINIFVDGGGQNHLLECVQVGTEEEEEEEEEKKRKKKYESDFANPQNGSFGSVLIKFTQR